MGYYQDLWNKQKKSGQYQTRDGGTVTGAKKGSGGNVVSAASADLGAGKAGGGGSGGNIVSAASGNLGAGRVRTANNRAKKRSGGSGSIVTASGGDMLAGSGKRFESLTKAPQMKAHKRKTAPTAAAGRNSIYVGDSDYNDRLAAYGVTEEEEEERQEWKDAALQAHYDTAGVGLYRTRDGGTVDQNWQGKNPDSGAGGSGEQNLMKLDQVYAPNAETWQQDAGILRMLDKFRGGDRSQLYYTDAAGNRAALPMERLNMGDGRYVASALRGWDGSDREVIGDHYGNSLTRGDFKRALAEGLYDRDNRAAYDSWMAGYSLPADALQYNVLNGGWQTVGGQSAGGGMSMADAMAAYGGVGAGDAPNSMMGSYSEYIDAAVDAILGQKDAADQSAADAKQMAYENYMRSKLGMDEATRGMATGVADSLAVQNDLAFQNNLAAIDRERLNAYADIEDQAAQMRADGNLQLAQMAAEQDQLAYERAMQEREWAYELQKAALNGSGSGGGAEEPIYTISELDKMIREGIISAEEYRALSGLGGSLPDGTAAEDGSTAGLGAKGYVDSNYYRLDFGNMTLKGIADELKYLVEDGWMTPEEQERTLKYYRGELSYDEL